MCGPPASAAASGQCQRAAAAPPGGAGTAANCSTSAGGKILAVGITPTGGAVTVGAPTPVVDLGNVGHDANVVRNHTDLFWYAVTKDGQRLLVSRPVARIRHAVANRRRHRLDRGTQTMIERSEDQLPHSA